MTDIGAVLGLAFGSMGLIVIGLSVPLMLKRVPMNSLYGVRIPKAYASEANWHAINAYGGRVLFVAGAVLVVLGALVVAFPPSSMLTVSMVSFAPVPIVLLALVPILRYAKRLPATPGAGESVTTTAPTALHHTSFVVRDLEKTAQQLADSLGIGPWNVWTIVPTECRVRGRESSFSFRVALATVGGGTYELVAPHSGRSVVDEHLEQHGPGFHHTCLVYPSLAAVREAKAELRRQGREPVQEASGGDVFDFGYFWFPEIGSLVELLYLDAAKLPEPETVIRAAR